MRLRQPLHTRTGRIIGGLLVLVIIITLIAALLWVTNTFGWRKWRVAEAQQFIGATLPSEAENVQFATEDEKTRILWLRFNLPDDSDLASFFSQLGYNAVLQQDFTPFPVPNPAEAALTWWTPQAAQSYSGLYAIHDGKVYELLLDKTNPANLMLYLRVYTIGMNNT